MRIPPLFDYAEMKWMADMQVWDGSTIFCYQRFTHRFRHILISITIRTATICLKSFVWRYWKLFLQVIWVRFVQLSKINAFRGATVQKICTESIFFSIFQQWTKLGDFELALQSTLQKDISQRLLNCKVMTIVSLWQQLNRMKNWALWHWPHLNCLVLFMRF